MVRGYLEWIVALPWKIKDDEPNDLALAQEILDDDHFGLEQVKDRILEHLAVLSLQPDARGTILCLAGPPGVGKTSLGRRSPGRWTARSSGSRWVACATRRRSAGHRRTYVGAMPGTVLRAMRDAGTTNPVILVDEIDKMSSGMGGDPTAAMLEVLDPEQNQASATTSSTCPTTSRRACRSSARRTSSIASPDRCATAWRSSRSPATPSRRSCRSRGATLVPRQIKRAGLRRGQVSFSDAALRTIISQYIARGRVRGLDRAIRSVCRKVARQVAEGTVDGRVSISGPRVRELLGNQRREAQPRRRRLTPGVASGLAWTPVGGDVLYVEVRRDPRQRAPHAHRSLGDVMRESAQAAYTWLRGHIGEVAPDAAPDWFKVHDVHVHVPRARSRRTAVGGHHDRHGARVARHRARRARRRAMTGRSRSRARCSRSVA